jgi:predicted CopG family antitoxin
MSKMQTRRSVSIHGETYARLREYAKLRGMSMSKVVEELLARKITDYELDFFKRRAEVMGMPDPTPASQVVAARPKEVF